MRPIKFKNWLYAILFLIGLSLVVDYYFIHILFAEKVQAMKEAEEREEQDLPTPTSSTAVLISKAQADENIEAPEPETHEDNFIDSLQSCGMDSQGVKTPDDLINHLKNDIGIQEQETDIENFHLRLADGSVRRIHITAADNTNLSGRREIRLFKLDDEGYPERLPIKKGETLESLLAQGQVFHKEMRGRWTLQDHSHLAVEMHNDSVFEFQYRIPGKTLSCRGKKCLCQ